MGVLSVQEQDAAFPGLLFDEKLGLFHFRARCVDDVVLELPETFHHVPGDAVRPDDHDEFDMNQWRPLEARFHDSQGNFDGKVFSDFFRDFLMRGGRYVRPASTFENFEERQKFMADVFGRPEWPAKRDRWFELADFGTSYEFFTLLE